MPYLRTVRPDRARFAPAAAARTRALAIAAIAAIAGCTSDNPMQGALRESIGNPFGGPTEAGFASLVRSNCGDRLVGGQRLATLMDGDTAFRQLTSRLYRGDISNDAFMNVLLQEHPAPDANIPATGCVIEQLNTCFNTRCNGRPAASPDDIAAEQIDAARQANLDELPAADIDAVDAMVDESDRAAAVRMDPLPSEDPSMLDTGPGPVERMGEPRRP